jgi:hypothetical protein
MMRELFDVTIVTSSSARADLLVMTRAGFGYDLYAETKLLHLCANLIVSTPNSQVACLAGSTVLCIPLVHGSYPAAINCLAFLRVNDIWWLAFLNGHVVDV